MSAMKVAFLVLGLAALSTGHYKASGGASAHGSMLINDKKFLDRFAYKVMLESCYGQQTIKEWYQYMDYYMSECYNEVKEAKKGRAPLKKVEPKKGSTETAPFFNAATVTWLKDEMLDKIAFVNCTFNRMNCTTMTNGEVDTAEMVEYYQGLELPVMLKAEIIQGVKDCAAPQCEKVEPYGPIDVDFITKMHFMKCCKTSRINACVRHTFRERQNEFELEGLEGTLDDLHDDVERSIAVVHTYLSKAKSDKFV